jgi:hypothetical protein
MFAATSITQGLNMPLNIYIFNCRSNNNFKSENDYLKGILKRAKNIKRRPLEFIEYWGLEKELSRKSLISCLKNLENHIEKTLETPIQDRGLTAFSW